MWKSRKQDLMRIATSPWSRVSDQDARTLFDAASEITVLRMFLERWCKSSVEGIRDESLYKDTIDMFGGAEIGKNP